MRTEFANIGLGFDKLVDPTGNANKLMMINSGGTAQTASPWKIYGGGDITSNSAYGLNSLSVNVSGVRVAAFGFNSLVASLGSDNTAFGSSAGATVAAGSQNTLIGSLADVNAVGAVNRTALGYGALATADNMIQLGNSAVTLVRTFGQIQSTIPTGTAPLAVSSTTLVPNLYAERAQKADLVSVAAWVSGTTYAVGNVVFSPIDFADYRRKTNGGGIIDPRNDPTNWSLITTIPDPYIRAVALQTMNQFNGAL